MAAGVTFGPNGSSTGVAVLTETAVQSAVAGIGTNLTTILAAVEAIEAKTNHLPTNPAAVGDVPTAVQVADAVLSRGVANVEAAAPQTCLATLLLATTNKSNTEAHEGYLTVYRTDLVTEHVRLPISTDANAAPIDGIGGN